jgi:integrase/recombinase XerD
MASREPTWGECKAFTFRTRDKWRAEAARIRENPKCRSKNNTIYCNHISDEIGDSFPISKLTQGKVTQIVIDLEETREWEGPSSPNLIIKTIRTVVNHCYDHGFIDEKPFKKLALRGKSEKRKTFFTVEEIRRLADACMDPFRLEPMADMVWMLGCTGMRVGELLNITSEDIEIEARRIHIGGREGFVTKGKNYRWVTLIDPLIPVLEKRLASVPTGQRLFDNDFGSVSSLRRRFNRIRDYAGFSPKHSFHALRRGFATVLSQLGIPPTEIQNMLGHANINTTLDYIQVADTRKVEALNKLNDYIKDGNSPNANQGISNELYAQLKAQNDNLQAQLNTLMALISSQANGSSIVEHVR